MEEIRIFEQEQRSRELEEELEAALNILKRTIMFTTKLVPHVIVISDSKEEVEIRPQPIIEEISQLVLASRSMEEGELQQPVVEEQPQLVLVPKHVEEKELQQPMRSGEAFLQELFKKGPISNIIFQRPRLRTRTIMKQKGKVHVEDQVKKHVKKKLISKAKES
jgi:hypothetical protein